VAAVLAGALVGAGLYLGNQAYIRASSPASCGAGCVTDGSVPLDSGSDMLSAEADIARANRRAVAGGSYVSVVLLDPFTYSTSGTVSLARMTDELRGASLAQQAANHGSGTLQVQLLLANEGTSAEEGEARAVRQIESLEGPDHIVAVAGMGLSTANTQTAATAFTADGMPMFGAVTTGDEFNGSGFYQVVPDVATQVKKLQADLRKVTSGQLVTLVGSDQPTDLYSTDLRIDFNGVFGPLPPSRVDLFDPAAPSEPFSQAATTICRQPGGSQVVLYAGREAQLPTLVQQFQGSTVCNGKNVTIVTGSDSNVLPASVTKPQLGIGIPGAAVTVDYSDIEDVKYLSAAFKTGYKPWIPPDSAPPAHCENQAYDPWAVATYNSVMAAVGASGGSSPDKKTVLSNAMSTQGRALYAGAAGKFGFTANGLIASSDIPVYQDQDGNCSLFPAGP
jgi:hypothetical protein